jgi:hypothetical protein
MARKPATATITPKSVLAAAPTVEDIERGLMVRPVSRSMVGTEAPL